MILGKDSASKYRLGAQDHLCSSTRIFAGVMVAEGQTEVLFQGRQPVPAVSLQLWPGLARHLYAVAPLPVRGVALMGFAGGGDGRAVKSGMLVNHVVAQRIFKQVDHIADQWRAENMAAGDAMDPGAGPIVGLRINKTCPCFDLAGMSHPCEAHLADTPALIVRCLDVERKESKGPARQRWQDGTH